MKYVFMAILADNCPGCMQYKELTEKNIIKAINVISNIEYKRYSSKNISSVKSGIIKLINSRFFSDIGLEFLPCLTIIPREQYQNNNTKKYDIEVFGKGYNRDNRPGLSLSNILKWMQKVIIDRVVITKNGLPISHIVTKTNHTNIEFIEAYSDSDSEEYISRV